MSYSLNSLKRGYVGDYMGITTGVIDEGTRSLASSSYNPYMGVAQNVGYLLWVFPKSGL